MKREETYIPYKERTPKELCRDINLKAEKLFLKKDKFGLLFFAVFFLVLAALHLYYKTYVNWSLGAIVVGAIMTVGFVIFKTNNLDEDDKRYQLILTSAILLLIALDWREKMYMNWWLGAVVVGTIGVVTFVFFKINQKLVNDMNLAVSPKQHLFIGKQLKKCVQIRNILCITLLFWLPFLTFQDLMTGWEFTKWAIVFVIGICAQPTWIDSDFNDDLDELEYRVEE